MRAAATVWAAFALALPAAAQIAVTGETVYTMAGPPIGNGMVLIRDGRIERVGPAADVKAPEGYRSFRAKVVTPGLIDARTVVGLSGYLNQDHDQDQVDRSKPIQPELRAIDAYDARETLIGYLRGYGITTLHTGHGPGILVSGQTMIVKTAGDTVEEALLKPDVMIAATLGEGARESARGASPGTRSKAIAMLRAELIKAQEAQRKRQRPAEGDKKEKEPPARDLPLEAWIQVLERQKPLLVTVNRANDILSAIRLGKEFNIRLVLDGVAEAHQALDAIKESGYPAIVHPAMQRAYGDAENIGFETPAKLKAAGIPFAMQSGFEGYVPKSRVLLFEAAVAAAHGLGFDNALSAVTIDAARLLGIADRVGSLEAGKDGDVALFDGDPFEYTSHCVGVVINGKVASEQAQ
ncbi:MAG: amidohydrolase family protein [Bryobacteraceae bacterium]|nr:amidohydrolase family protein [Bryobacteraceae bacterium]